MSPPESTNNSSDDEMPPETLSNNVRTPQPGKSIEISSTKQIIDRARETDQNQSSNTDTDFKSHGYCQAVRTEPQPTSNLGKKSPGKLVFEPMKITDSQSLLQQNNLFPGNFNCVSSMRLDDGCVSEDNDDAAIGLKPSMLRKKSGELVRPALRTPLARCRPSSVPGTPTYAKAVHFDSHLEHIRHFLQVDRPLAVSAGSSPVPAYENESKFPFEDESARELSVEWEIILTNFPAENSLRLAQVVRVERVFLSCDYKIFIGSVAVRNLAFKKNVVVRFTLDYWKTTSEVVAEFNQDLRQPIQDGYDRFNFNIKLSDQANLESKTMFFCVKYCVNGKEYWDNNNGTNFQVDFRKNVKTVSRNINWSDNSSRNSQMNSIEKTHHLPRSNSGSPCLRPKSMPYIFDDYADSFDGKYQFGKAKSELEYFGDIGATALPCTEEGNVQKNQSVSDSQQRNTGQSNSNAFGNRYSFVASLSAAINAQNLPRRQRVTTSKPIQGSCVNLSQPLSPSSLGPMAGKETTNSEATSQKISTSPHYTSISKPDLSSESYNDLLDKYCFVRSSFSPYFSNHFHLKAYPT